MTDKTPWTPGPWGVVKDGIISETLGPRVCVGGRTSADVKMCGNRWIEGAWRDDPEAHANMNLIAAAPELAEALEEEVNTRLAAQALCGALGCGQITERGFAHQIASLLTGSHVGDRARAALKKARGEA